MTRGAPLLALGALVAVGLTPLGSASEAAPARPGARELLVADVGTRETWSANWGAGGISWGRDAERPFLRCTTTGAGDLSMVTTRDRLPGPVDLRKRFLRLWIKVDDASPATGTASLSESSGCQAEMNVTADGATLDTTLCVLQPDGYPTSQSSFEMTNTTSAGTFVTNLTFNGTANVTMTVSSGGTVIANCTASLETDDPVSCTAA